MPPLTSVLLVDHDQTSTFLTEYRLRRAGVEAQVHLVLDGQQGLTLLAALPPPAPELIFFNYDYFKTRPFALTGEQFVAEVERRYPQRHVIIALLVTHLSDEELHRLQRAHQRGPIFRRPLTKQNIEALLAQYFSDIQPAA